MVTFYIVSEYSSTSPAVGGGEKIAGGPLYDLNRVQQILQDGTGLQLWTKDAANNVLALGWQHGDVINLINKLRAENFIDSQWCENGKGAFAACDAYCVQLPEWIEAVSKTLQIEYFVKFAINKAGTMVLTISCHTS